MPVANEREDAGRRNRSKCSNSTKTTNTPTRPPADLLCRADN